MSVFPPLFKLIAKLVVCKGEISDFKLFSGNWFYNIDRIPPLEIYD